MQRTFALSVLAFAFVAIPIQAQETLAWKFKEGDKFYAEEKTNIRKIITTLGNTEDTEESQINIVSYQVKKKTADSVVLVQTLEELTTVTKRGKQDPNAQDVLDKMKGHQFTITLNKLGKITKFEGYSGLIEKIGSGDPEQDKVLRAILPVDFFKKSAEVTFSMMPDKAVKKGDTWDRETKMSMGPIGTFKVLHSYKYEGNEKDLAVITGTNKLEYMVPKDAAGLPFKIIKGEMKADNAKNRLLFDAKLGRPSQDTASVTIIGSMTMEINNMEIEVEMRVEQNSVTRVTTKRPGKK